MRENYNFTSYSNKLTYKIIQHPRTLLSLTDPLYQKIASVQVKGLMGYNIPITTEKERKIDKPRSKPAKIHLTPPLTATTAHNSTLIRQSIRQSKG